MFTTLISADQLFSLKNFVIFDCRFDLQNLKAGYEAYRMEHIPKAFYLDLEHDLCGTKTGVNGRHPLPECQMLADKLRNLGVLNTTQVIAYDAQGGVFAARLWWLLRWLGHEAVAILDGGIQAWTTAGYPLTAELADASPPGIFSIRTSLQSSVTVKDVVVNLESKAQLLIDARSPDRFRGENEALDPIAGHIPNAINRFFKDNLRENGHFKSAQHLRDEWILRLVKIHAEHTIHYCGSGVTACHNLLALEIAGLKDAKLYAGSWSEWCADLSLPIAVG